MLISMTSEPELQRGVGEPDGFRRLWTPHRMAYIQGENKPTGPAPGDGCPFCGIPSLGDEDGLVVARGSSVYAVLNLYPYNGGHLMVVPYRHVADYTELDEAETAELAHTLRGHGALSVDVRGACHSGGLYPGNRGKAMARSIAGGGAPGHGNGESVNRERRASRNPLKFKGPDDRHG